MQSTNEKGFTLVEVMVAISIFAIIVSVGIGALFNMSQAYAYSKAQQRITDQLNFVLENMMRELRTGSNYTCANANMPSIPDGLDCLNAQTIAFSSDPVQTGAELIAYTSTLDSTLTKSSVLNDVQEGPIALLPDEIEDLEFNVTVYGNNDGQPVVTVSLSGSITVRQQTDDFIIQMAVTQRSPNFPVN